MSVFRNKAGFGSFVAIAMLAMCLPVLTGAGAAATPMIEGGVSTDWVAGNMFPPGSVIDITINGTLFPASAITNANGEFFSPHEVLGPDLDFGDVIVVSDGTTTKELTLTGPLSILVDKKGTTARGKGPARGVVSVYVEGDACVATMQARVSELGTWFLDLTTTCPGGVGSFMGAQINYGDVDGDSTVAEPGPSCFGREITVDIGKGQMPTEDADVILGTEEADTINALGGKDRICGLGGDDVIRGGEGNDYILGDAGNDMLYGEKGRDVIQGGVGNDMLDGGLNNDRMSGNGGRDTLFGGNGRDRLDGNAGPDTLNGGGGNDRLLGGGGNDFIDGRIGDDFCVEGETVVRCEFDYIK
ncbi:MAG: hypothetical protein HKN94_01650 [Acidimicrobiales bacterium]|nr:hypothetical protein [Acidimicrobiia bacterium]NNC78832.1 hypothetical protein [Acidimicrobiales bacterium]RZV46344.1 MAG: calcium-binding protein [Acidimicrobiales bacterium]